VFVFENYFGKICDKKCSCINGYCDPVTGTCSCNFNFAGSSCDIRCLDLDCKTNCTCNNTNYCSNNQTLCTDEELNISNNNISIVSTNTTSLNNLNINETSIFFFGSIIIIGNASFENSILSFNTSQTIIKGDLSFSNSSFIFSNSTIVVDGCVYLKNNTQLTIDISKYNNEEQNSKITLINSLNSCLNNEGNISYIYMNQPTKCTSVTNNLDSNSLSIIFKINTCESSIGVQFQYHIIKILIFIFILHMVGK